MRLRTVQCYASDVMVELRPCGMTSREAACTAKKPHQPRIEKPASFQSVSERLEISLFPGVYSIALRHSISL